MKLAHPSRYVLRVIWLLTTLLLLVGLVSPIMTMTQFVFFDESFSIVSGIWQLYQQQHYVLFLMIGLFSVVLPLAKM
jgi:paraquat-inducible protein A